MRYKITIEYDGSAFLGWQKQNEGVSVQEVLDIAISSFYGRRINISGAGRTDVGVHALGQVAHFDAAKPYDCFAIRNALNCYLREYPVSILEVNEVPDSFHARFSAIKRSYVYRILNRRAPAALDRKRVWQVPPFLDDKVMNEVAQVLIGTHDFTSFRNVMCQAKNPVRTLDKITVTRDNEEIRIYVEAKSFLHNQVRIIVGTLFNAGLGKLDAEGMAKILEAKDRNAAGPTAPACGLYLLNVVYPDL